MLFTINIVCSIRILIFTKFKKHSLCFSSDSSFQHFIPRNALPFTASPRISNAITWLIKMNIHVRYKYFNSPLLPFVTMKLFYYPPVLKYSNTRQETSRTEVASPSGTNEFASVLMTLMLFCVVILFVLAFVLFCEVILSFLLSSCCSVKWFCRFNEVMLFSVVILLSIGFCVVLYRNYLVLWRSCFSLL